MASTFIGDALDCPSAAFAGRFLEAAAGEHAGELGAHVGDESLLGGREREAGVAGLETAQLVAGAEAFGEIRRADHQREQVEQLELDLLRLLPVSGAGGVIEAHHDFRHDAGAGERAAVRAHEEAGAEQFLPADEHREIRALALDGVQRLLEAAHVLGRVLGADDARAIHGEALQHGQRDFVGEDRDVIHHDVDRRLGGEFAEVGLDAFLGEFVIIRAGDGNRAAAEIGAVVAHFQNELDVRLGGSGEDGTAVRFLADDAHHGPAFLVAQADELAHAAVRIESGHALVSHPADDVAELVLIDAALGVVGDDVGDENAVDGGLG